MKLAQNGYKRGSGIEMGQAIFSRPPSPMAEYQGHNIKTKIQKIQIDT